MLKILILLGISCLLGGKTSIGQNNVRRLNYVIMIDNEIPPPGDIRDGIFLIKNTATKTEDSIHFNYDIGSILMLEKDYEMLFRHVKDSIILTFRYVANVDKQLEIRNFSKHIPSLFINKEYIIFKIYNYFNPESRMIYSLKKDEYKMELRAPAYGSVISKRKIRVKYL